MKADSCSSGHEETGRTSVEGGVLSGAAPSANSHIRWALMALHLVRNKLRAIGLSEDDTALVNLAAAESTLLAAQIAKDKV
jgi:hypothetical protein